MYCNDDNTVTSKASIKAAFENASPTPSLLCCNACQAISSVCIPVAPNKCQGGCTITSFAF
ncbi:MAG: hypothetical protein LBK00_01170 [Treponema sp.]|nr:hypothetical protein [Treponema sp.]